MPNYRIDTFKAWASRDIERSWSNSYEFVSSAAEPTALQPLGEQLIAFEKKLHLPSVEFLQVRISSHEIEPAAGYDPSAFLTIPTEGVGTLTVVGDPLDFNCCWVVQRVPSSGRAGRLFFRGCLQEGDVTAALDGTFRLVPASVFSPTGAKMTGFATDMAPYLTPGSGAPGDSKLNMIGTYAGVTIARPISALRSGGVSINKRNHRYFDRGPVG